MLARLLSDRRAVLAVLLALVLAGGGLRGYRAANPTTERQSPDEKSYAGLALDIAQTGTYGALRLSEPFHWPPGAPLMFAVAAKLDPPSAGDDDRRTIPSAYWAQALVGTAVIPLVFAIGLLLAGSAAGLVGAGIVAFYPPLVRTTGELLSEPLGATLLAGAVLLLVWGWQRPPPRVPWRFALAGLVFGLAILTRADLLLAPFLVALLVLASVWRSAGPRLGLLSAGALAAGALLALAPWAIYASSRQNTFVAVTTGDAPALFVGTYLPGDGTTGGLKRELGDATRRRVPELRDVRDSQLPAEAVLNTVAARHPGLTRDAALRREARANLRKYALGDPIEFSGMVLSKLRRMWLRSSRAGSPIASRWTRTIHFVLVVVCAAALIAAVIRRRDPRLGAILLILLYSTALHALVVAKPRYNLPLMPILIAGGIASIFMLVGEARVRRSAAPQPAQSGAATVPPPTLIEHGTS